MLRKKPALYIYDSAWYASHMRQDTPIIKIETIDSFRSLTTALTKLEHALPQNNLNQFLVFNTAYLIVSRTIAESCRNHYFSNPQFVETFTVSFARYYFIAINETASKSKKLPPAWGALNTASRLRKMPNALLLLMGANAHINHDLPLALARLVDNEKTKNLISDVIKIDKLLMKCGSEIISSFDEKNWLLDLLKRRLIFVYYRPTMYTILYWRIRAWRDYRSIRANGLKNNPYAQRSVRIARGLLLLGRFIG